MVQIIEENRKQSNFLDEIQGSLKEHLAKQQEVKQKMQLMSHQAANQQALEEKKYGLKSKFEQEKRDYMQSILEQIENTPGQGKGNFQDQIMEEPQGPSEEDLEMAVNQLQDEYKPRNRQEREELKDNLRRMNQRAAGQQTMLRDPFLKAKKYAAAGLHDASRIAGEEVKAGIKEKTEERKFHTTYSAKQEEEANKLRDSIPKKENALNFARDAVESGNMGTFSLDYLADLTGKDVFRTAKGAQLLTAGKENLLSNMSRVSARAQNQWFEQRLASMFPKIGQSKEANLTVQEMLEGEVALDSAYLKEFDRISEEDEGRYGYVRKDASKRAHNAIKPLEKEVFNRSSYRMRELEEQEMGAKKLNSKVESPVPRGTPLTLANMNILYKKYGDKAIEKAEKLGYRVPTREEFELYQVSPQEFRERF
ncbi:hypothetical protein UFOVP1357_53 [uncultured Caudovirales phage]|uniref:Uncharacterized protein n=1 Tax=uncultured Caudovirales phage TaxID=2100421 RepID=A0A6J5KN63_9CAUD|nr:hypothetical protein UFOVP18_19 [uncultured Caudovirales phage]CAB4126753.1 hypothetical protein UFOVP82_21 [uncultured Caudovirales phage]CAB4132386.1 hypothetical protein UFOVP258_12 [uncultured Caudovirales phage]CAB4146310.1 hypothetical protein UFOVP502_4 [uncultured Caudovirales phage]CAB4200568.1 hypothetical protein UFOVP1357_53 [uncultured Caudovirales phage]